MDGPNFDQAHEKQAGNLREKPLCLSVMEYAGVVRAPVGGAAEAARSYESELMHQAAKIIDVEKATPSDPETVELSTDQFIDKILREHADKLSVKYVEEEEKPAEDVTVAADAVAGAATAAESGEAENSVTPTGSARSMSSFVCRICHNAENPDRLVAPCYCKGSLTYVHIHCLERWISTSRSTTCELCQFQYNTEQTLRYTCLQSLRLWYSRSISRRALQEDCQMFSLLTLVAFGIVGTLLVGIQYYFLQGRNWGLSQLWTKGWLIFFLFTTLVVYFINIYMIVRSQLTPWYHWWQSARDIKLILENRKPFQVPPAPTQQPTEQIPVPDSADAKVDADSSQQLSQIQIEGPCQAAEQQQTSAAVDIDSDIDGAKPSQLAGPPTATTTIDMLEGEPLDCLGAIAAASDVTAPIVCDNVDDVGKYFL